MMRRSAPLLLLTLCAVAALATTTASAFKAPAPDTLGVDTQPFAAIVKWRVPESARVVVEVGPDDRYGIWSPTTLARDAQTGRTVLTNLEPATTYRYRVVARFRSGTTAEAKGTFRTDPWPHAVNAFAPSLLAANRTGATASPFITPPRKTPGSSGSSGSSGASNALPKGTPKATASSPLLVNGNPVFPRMVWRQCPSYYSTSINAGINLFLGVSCVEPSIQFEQLAGRALSTVDAATPGLSGPGHVGWHLPDEADVSVGVPHSLPAPKANGRVTFLTLTDKFSAGAAPGPYGKDIYPAFFERADVIGFDTYPVEVRCSLEQIDNVFWMQRELISLTGGKPTFQWIEAGPMEHCRHNQDPTPDVVRAETWLAIAGGATGIGYFPDYWAEDIRNEIRRVNRDIVALGPALLSPPARVSWSVESPVRVTARRYNGATYVIAVNTSTEPAKASFALTGLGGRKLHVFGEDRLVNSLGDLVVDKLPGLGSAIYVLPPAGW